MVRPTKQTPETIAKLEQAFSMDCTVAEACFQAGIAESTYFDWCKENPELSERFKALKHKAILKARQTIYDNLDDVKTAQWFLERKRKEEFSLKQELQHSGSFEPETEYLKQIQKRLRIGEGD